MILNETGVCFRAENAKERWKLGKVAGCMGRKSTYRTCRLAIVTMCCTMIMVGLSVDWYRNVSDLLSCLVL